MATVQQHVDQWMRNRAFLQSIPATYPDWRVTAAFYISLHAVEALLTSDQARARSSHAHRRQILIAEKRYEFIFRHFDQLYSLAHVARYSATPDRWIPLSEFEAKVLRGLVYPIEKSVRHLLGKSKTPIRIDDLPDIELAPLPTPTPNSA